MIEWASLTMNEIDELDRQLPVIIPIGLTEAHGPAIAVSVDTLGAEHFAQKVCEETGAILMPSIAYGYIGEMRDYVGTVGVTSDTLAAMVNDICCCLASQGFKKIIFLSGHVTNARGVELGFERAFEKYPDLKSVYWVYWFPAGVPMKHADKIETEFAILTGCRVDTGKLPNYEFVRPWHAIRSRYPYNSESGGVQGDASQADPKDSADSYERVLKALIDNVNEAIKDHS